MHHYPLMLNTYLDQIERAARDAGVNLAEACRREGIAATTLMRWRKGEVSPREATAQALLARIAKMAAGEGDSEEQLADEDADSHSSTPPKEAALRINPEVRRSNPR